MCDYESSDFISDDEDESYDYADFMDIEGDELSEDISDEASESDLDDIIEAYFPYTAERKKRVVFIDDYIYY